MPTPIVLISDLGNVSVDGVNVGSVVDAIANGVSASAVNAALVTYLSSAKSNAEAAVAAAHTAALAAKDAEKESAVAAAISAKDAEIASLQAQVAALTPPAPEPGVVVLTPLQLLGRLTQAEEVALNASTDLAVVIVRNRLIAASEIRSDDPRTAEGKAILIEKGIITAERAEAIFAA